MHEPDANQIIRSDNSNNELELCINRLYSKQNGEDQSLLIFTKFDKNWNFEIYKYVINCENIW